MDRNGVDLSPSLNDGRLRVDTLGDHLAFDQLLEENFGATYLDGGVIFRHIDVQFDRILLQEADVEVVNFIDKGELGLVVGPQTLTHLRRLRVVIVEVNGDHSDELFLDLLCCHLDRWDFGDRIPVEVSILNFEIQDVLIHGDLTFLGLRRELTPSIVRLDRSSQKCSVRGGGLPRIQSRFTLQIVDSARFVIGASAKLLHLGTDRFLDQLESLLLVHVIDCILFLNVGL